MRAPLVTVAFAATVVFFARPAVPEDPAPPAAEACRLRWALRDRSDGSSCRSCHTLPDTPAGRIMRRHAGGEHNSGIVYEEAVQRAALHLRPTKELPSEIVLVNGRVTCTTCHDGASQARKKIAVPGGMPQLCTSCHAL